MLTKLLIKNYALITELEMLPARALNIITGETGAGKSIMLGAIGLLLGKRADTKALFNGKEKCIIEGEFDVKAYRLQPFFEDEFLDYEDLCIIRREISPSGKSRAFVNDTPVTLEVLRRLGGFLMDVHSQHDTLMLGKHDFQLALIDGYAQNHKLLIEYGQSYDKYKVAKKSLEALQEVASQIRKDADYNDFLLEELVKANLSNDEQEELEKEVQLLEHAEEIKVQLNQALEALQRSEFSVISGLQNANASFQQLDKYTQKYKGLGERLSSVMIELLDINEECEKEEELMEYDPQRTEAVRLRLGLIYQLQKKHQVADITALLSLQEELESKSKQAMNMDEDLADAEKELEKCLHTMQTLAERLRKSRIKVFAQITKKITALLKDLGMGDAALQIENRSVPPGPKGMDEINLLFSANKGIPPQTLKDAASGGEFSRLMFCIKFVLADKMSLPTIIFDEIDTGISGEIALKLGEMMKVMAQQHQVISISHLPQVAAKGDAHYFVYKDNSASKTISKMKALTDTQRIEAIARMIGGDQPSETAYKSAKELIEQ